MDFIVQVPRINVWRQRARALLALIIKCAPLDTVIQIAWLPLLQEPAARLMRNVASVAIVTRLVNSRIR